MKKVYSDRGTFALKSILPHNGIDFIKNVQKLYHRGYNRIVPIYQTMHPGKLPEHLLMAFIALSVSLVIQPGHQVIQTTIMKNRITYAFQILLEKFQTASTFSVL